ncbi:MAG: DUF1684 domain-containing protein [Candidatus Eisenbacteria bacterium]|nr:DUF1684 domain-containing protein [Candidatus Eisenbacteria bacterium]
MLAVAAVLLVLAGAAPAVSAAPAAALARPAPASPVKLTPAAADSITRAILEDRAATEAGLMSSPISYLATVQRVDFGAKTALTVGSAAGNDVRIADAGIAAHHLSATVVGDSFRVQALDPGATFKLKDAERREAVLGPSSIQAGRFTLRLSHQRFPAIIVFDPQSPRFRDYKGLRWFPVNLGYRYEVQLTPNPRPDTVIILSTRGSRRRAVRVGWFDFMAGRTACRLEATRLLEPGVGENDLAVFFRDATTGKESYGVGRYVDPQRLQDGRYRLDFNLAYNPACAVSEHYNCPLPPRANALRVAIRAGEMDSHYLH